MDKTSQQLNPPAPFAAQSTLLNEDQFARLRDLLASYSGVYLDAARQRVLEMGVAQRLAATGTTLAGYERLIHSVLGRDELQQLAELVLNHETFFFRNKAHMRALIETLLPELHARKLPGAPIRIWSAGCATGEEAYSLAIAALEALGAQAGRALEVWATDLSSVAVVRARAGYYQGRALAQVTPELLARYFTPRGAGYVVGETLRRAVRCEVLNLLEPFPPAAQGVDMIFCQNVMIYFQLATSRALLERFHACLPEGGLLFLGFSETLWNVFDGFHTREVAGGYVYYKEVLKTSPGARSQAAPRAAPRTALPVRQPPKMRGVTNSPLKTSDHGPLIAAPSEAARIQQGRALLGQGQAEQALDVLRQIPPRSSHATEALMLAARIHADRGDLDLAVAEIQRVLELDRLAEDAYLLLGIINGRQGEWGLAAQQFERARYLNMDAPLISYHLAESLRQLGRAEAAVREYRTALRKLAAHPPDTVLDGVAVGWLRETCQRHIEQLSRG